MNAFDPTPYLSQDEGQHFERKSLFHGPPGRKKGRSRREVRDEVAEYVAAFANAEGGVLILGLEDDGELTGHNYPDDALDSLLNVPKARLEPALSPGFVVAYRGVQLIVFDVAASDVPVKVTGNGFPLRMGDDTIQASESQISAPKFHGMAESWESRPSGVPIEALDARLLAAARRGAGLEAATDEEYLLQRKLADRRGRDIVLRRAAELLFTEHGPEHPNAGVRLFRVVGTERKLGAEHNVEERPRIEGPLPAVLDETMRIISGLLRRPSRLIGTKFQQAPEYPDFAWREALLNAIAHRDYFVEGRAIEVWLYDDRMEVISPGALMPEISLENLRSLQRVHASRNPRLVRALVDLGYMRDQGEGIPRMFHEMQDSFLPIPELDERDHSFSVTLRNTPLLDEADKEFVGRFADEELSREEFRALLEAHRQGSVDNAGLRRITGLDTLQASQLLRKLRDRGYLELHAAGSASYYTLLRKPNELGANPDKLESKTGELETKTGELESKTGELGSKTGELGSKMGEHGAKTGEHKLKTGELESKTGELESKTGELEPKTGESQAKAGELESREDLLAALPDSLRRTIDLMSARPGKQQFRKVLRAVAAHGEWTPRQLATLFKRVNVRKLVDDHLTPMVQSGELERTIPETPTDPRQAYRSTASPFGPLWDVKEEQ